MGLPPADADKAALRPPLGAAGPAASMAAAGRDGLGEAGMVGRELPAAKGERMPAGSKVERMYQRSVSGQYNNAHVIRKSHIQPDGVVRVVQPAR